MLEQADDARRRSWIEKVRALGRNGA
jgi:hypothetical protein